MSSTRNLTAFPSAPLLLRTMKSLAMLEALVERVWEYRYFSFNSNWSDTEQMGSMRNGSGDDLFALFDENGCFIRGFHHESLMSPWSFAPRRVWPGVLDHVPSCFAGALNEPAFHMADTTFCIWRRPNDSSWQVGDIAFPDGDDPDGSGWMLPMYEGQPETYSAFAREYYEINLSHDLVAAVFSHVPLSKEIVRASPRSEDFAELLAEADEIGYPR